jgi:hypothetical protein
VNLKVFSPWLQLVCCNVQSANRAGIEAFDADKNRTTMYDLIFIGIMAVFFIVGGLYVRVCEKL